MFLLITLQKKLTPKYSNIAQCMQVKLFSLYIQAYFFINIKYIINGNGTIIRVCVRLSLTINVLDLGISCGDL